MRYGALRWRKVAREGSPQLMMRESGSRRRNAHIVPRFTSRFWIAAGRN
jgi:hypothetical protein